MSQLQTMQLMILMEGRGRPTDDVMGPEGAFPLFWVFFTESKPWGRVTCEDWRETTAAVFSTRTRGRNEPRPSDPLPFVFHVDDRDAFCLAGLHAGCKCHHDGVTTTSSWVIRRFRFVFISTAGCRSKGRGSKRSAVKDDAG